MHNCFEQSSQRVLFRCKLEAVIPRSQSQPLPRFEVVDRQSRGAHLQAMTTVTRQIARRRTKGIGGNPGARQICTWDHTLTAAA